MPENSRRDGDRWNKRIPENRLRKISPKDREKIDEKIRRADALARLDFSKVAKIPEIEHRIFRRKDSEDSPAYIIFLADRYYDKEKHQTRNRKVIIGTDLGDLLPGMMMIREDKYYRYFDRNGRLRNDPLKKRTEGEAGQESPEEAQEAPRMEKKLTKEQFFRQRLREIDENIRREKERLDELQNFLKRISRELSAMERPAIKEKEKPDS